MNSSDDFLHSNEVLDLTNENVECKNLAPFVKDINGATGSLIDDEPVICGGYTNEGFSDECYTIDEFKTKLFNKMTTKRAYAASIKVNDTLLWISGGYNGFNILKLTEFVENGLSIPGPELPLPLMSHVVVTLSLDLVMVIGGRSPDMSYSTRTFYFDFQAWMAGPDLKLGRFDHSAGVLIDSATKENLIVVAGGNGGCDTVEILYPRSNAWRSGKS